MSRAHPIISITGSSGAGTTSVKKTFEQIFRREKVVAAYIEGDAFHRYNRFEMRNKMREQAEREESQLVRQLGRQPAQDELEKSAVDQAARTIATTRVRRNAWPCRRRAPRPGCRRRAAP